MDDEEESEDEEEDSETLGQTIAEKVDRRLRGEPSPYKRRS